MSEFHVTSELEEPSEELKDAFKTTVFEALSRTPIDPAISVLLDKEGHYSVTFEEVVECDGEPRVIYHDYNLYADGKLEKRAEEEPLSEKTARELDPSPVKAGETEFDLKLASLMAQGHSEEDALGVMVKELFELPGIEKAAMILSRRLVSDDDAEALGVNTVSTSELIEVIDKVKANFTV